MRRLLFGVLTLLLIVGQMGNVAAISADQKAALDSGVLYFNTEDSSCDNGSSAAQTTPSVPSGSSVYILGDSVTVRAEASYNTALSAKGLHPFIDASVGRSWNGAGQSGAGKTSNGNYLPGSQALTNDSAAVKAAGGIVIALGSNGGLSGNPIQDVITKVRTINATAPIWWVNVTGTDAWKSANLASYMGNFNKALSAVDNSKLQVVDWATAVAPNGDPFTTPGGPASQADPQGMLADGLHPNQKGVPVLTNLVVSALTGGGTGSPGTASSPGVGGTCCSGVTGSTTTFLPNNKQVANAMTIIGLAKTENLGQRGALIGLMAGLTESTLHNEANSNVPLSLTNPARDGVGHDGKSVGVFQQQPQYTWSTIATGPAAIDNPAVINQLMTPAYAAEAFFGVPRSIRGQAPDALSKGVQDKTNWTTADTWVVAQEVQGSQFSDGSNYKAQVGAAQALLTKYWATSPPIPLPVPFTAPAGTGSGSAVTASAGSDCLGTSGFGNGTGKFTDNTSITFPGVAQMQIRAKELADPTSSLFLTYCNQINKQGKQVYCSGWCDHATGVVWGHSHTGYPSAYDHWQTLVASGQAHPGDRSPPVGALLFYVADHYPGHAAVYLGNNMVMSTDVLNDKTGRVGGVYITSASSLENGPWHFKYFGWTPPIFTTAADIK